MMTTTGGVWKVSGKALQVLLGKSYCTSDVAQIQSSRLRSSFYPHSCTRTRYLRACSWGCTSCQQGASHCLMAQHHDLRPSNPTANRPGVVKDTDLWIQQIHINYKEQKSLGWSIDSILATTDKEAMLGYQQRQSIYLTGGKVNLVSGEEPPDS